MKSSRTLRSIFRSPLIVLGLAAVATLGTSLVPACSFSSCTETNTCDDDSVGGQGGQTTEDETSRGGEGGQSDTPSCESSEVACDGACIDPATDRNFCGASESCEGDEKGESCGENEDCFEGECTAKCGDDELRCGGDCIDPVWNNNFCGAVDACDTGTACDTEQSCVSGRCWGWDGASSVKWNLTTSEKPIALGIDGTGQATAGIVEWDSMDGLDSNSTTFNPGESIWTTLESRGKISGASEDRSHLAVNEQGKTELIWALATTTVFKQVWGAGRVGDGDWSLAEEHSGPTVGDLIPHPNDQLDVAIDKEGTTFLAWREVPRGDGSDESNRVKTRVRLRSTSEWELPPREVVVPGEDEPNPGPAEPRLAPLGEVDGVARAVVVFTRSFGGVQRLVSSTITETEAPEAVRVAPEDLAGLVINHDAHGNGLGQAAAIWTVGAGMDGIHLWTSIYEDGGFGVPHRLIPEVKEPIDEPYVLVDDQGVAHFLWRQGIDPSSFWSSSYRFDDGSWSAPQMISRRDGTVNWPSLDADGFGNVQVVWTANDAGSPSAWTNRRDAFTGTWGKPFTLEEGDAAVKSTAIAMNDEGRAMVVWWSGTEPGTLGYNYFR